MSGKHAVLAYWTVQHAVTLKWLSIVFHLFIQSQRVVTATARHSTATVRLRIYRIVSHSYKNRSISMSELVRKERLTCTTLDFIDMTGCGFATFVWIHIIYLR